MNDNYIRIGVITGTHAIKGWFKIYITTDNVNRFSENSAVFLKEKETYKHYKITGFRVHKKNSGLLKFEGIDDIDSAEKYRHYEIYINKADAERTKIELDEDEFYYFDIIGCSAFLEGKLFGTVSKVFNAGAGEILVIKDGSGKEFMVPFVEKMVDTGRIGEKRIDLYPLEGLFDI